MSRSWSTSSSSPPDSPNRGPEPRPASRQTTQVTRGLSPLMTRSLPGNPDFEGGTLKVGKLVDFVVWSENRTRCPPERTRTIDVLAAAVGSSDSTIAWPRTPSRTSSPCAFETAARPPPAGDVDGDRHSGRSRAVRQRRQPRRADARLPRRARGGPLSVTETFVALRLDIENCGTGRAPGQRRRLRPNPTDNGSPRRQPSVPST